MTRLRAFLRRLLLGGDLYVLIDPYYDGAGPEIIAITQSLQGAELAKIEDY